MRSMVQSRDNGLGYGKVFFDLVSGDKNPYARASNLFINYYIFIS